MGPHPHWPSSGSVLQRADEFGADTAASVTRVNDEFATWPCYLVGDIHVRVADKSARRCLGNRMTDVAVAARSQMQDNVFGQWPDAIGLGRAVDEAHDVTYFVRPEPRRHDNLNRLRIDAHGVLHLQFGRLDVVSARPGRNKAVADIADGANEGLVFGAEFGAQSADMDVNRSSAAVVVVAPHFLQQLGAAEDATRPLRQEAQQFELLEREVESASADARRVGSLIDDEVAAADLVIAGFFGESARPVGSQPQSGVDFGRTSGIEHDVVDAPIGVDRDKSAFSDDDDQGRAHANGAKQSAQRSNGGQVAADVDENRVAWRRVDERAGIGRQDAHPVGQQSERRQHLGGGLQRVSEEEQRRGQLAPPQPVIDVDGGIDARLDQFKGGLGTATPSRAGYRVMDDRRPGEPRMLLAADGERLSAVHVPGPKDVAFVLAHGFTGRWRYARVRRLVRLLSDYGGVVAFDFRGHGSSSGKTSLGLDEPLDLDAAVNWARLLGYQRVVTIGFSMGGAVAVRHAAEIGNTDATVSVSAPAFWFYRGTVPTRRVQRMVSTRYGRVLANAMLRTRIGVDPWLGPMPADPATCAAAIPPKPLLVVHGDQDAYFPLEHPQALVASAIASWEAQGGPGVKPELWIEPGFGHAENSVTDDLAVRIAMWARGTFMLEQ